MPKGVYLHKKGYHPPTEWKKGQHPSPKTEFKKGQKSAHWKGGRFYLDGYIYILSPNHPFATKQGYVAEHRLVMEKMLGRYMKPEEIAHHINGKKDDNRSKNLMYFPTKNKHQKFHYPKGIRFHKKNP